MPQSADNAGDELERAFPLTLRAEARHVVATLPHPLHAPHDGLTVVLDGEELRIPSRIYNAEPSAAAVVTLSPVQVQVLHCLYTRHHDGFVRQRHLLSVLREPHSWTAPFALQLLGEYVAEIHVVLLANQSAVTSAPYVRFCAQNPEFVEITKRRIVSYWDCYYRWGDSRRKPLFPRFLEYPAYLVADALGWWHSRELRRLRAR